MKPMLIMLSILMLSSGVASAQLSTGPLEKTTTQDLGDLGHRHSLQGIGDVLVLVFADSTAELYGMSSASIRTAVELKVRQGGIRVRTASDKRLYPALLASVTANQIGNVGFVYSIRVSLQDAVSLQRNPRIEFATNIWPGTADQFGFTLSNEFSATVRQVLDGELDRFMNDLLAANPPSRTEQ